MLNLEQKKAVEIIDKPLIVIAGPGTGKTNLIVNKIKYLIGKKQINPKKILALTFTNKSSNEMSTRVENISKIVFESKTFHSFSLDIIEEFLIEIKEIDKNYSLISKNDSQVFFLENLTSFNLKSVEIKNNISQITTQLLSSIFKFKEFSYSINDIKKIKTENKRVKEDLLNVYKKYEEYKDKNNFIDYTDLLLYVYNLLKNNSKIREKIRNRFDYILVDEFQDTNKIQLEILKLITKKNNITIVGDNKQSIYSFRGANFRNLEIFKNYFPNYKEIFLHQNYRSSKKVLKLINDFTLKISNEKELLKSNLDEIGKVNLICAETEISQKSYIIERILEIKKKDKNASFGILSRKKFELNSIINLLDVYNLDYDCLDNKNFLSNENIKEILHFLEILNSPTESNISLFLILSKLNIKKESLRKISRKSSSMKISIFEALEIDNLVDFENDKKVLLELKKNLDKIINLKNSSKSIFEIINKIIIDFNYYQKAILNEDEMEIFNLNNLLNFSNNFSKIYKSNDLNSFLKYCIFSENLDLENSYKKNSISKIELSTIHKSKGKEFDYVFLINLNEKRFPSNFSNSKFDLNLSISKEDFLEEEKRLFYVAISRAKKELNLIYNNKFEDNKNNSKKSLFLEGLDLNLINYDKKIDQFKISIKDEIKIHIIKKINNLLLINDFENAKCEIDILKNLFSKKDLTDFFNKNNISNEKILEYKKKLVKNDLEKVEFDYSKMIYSVSQLNVYKQCPKKYLFQYIYKIPTISKHYFDFGTSIHSTLEELIPQFKNKNKEELFAIAIKILHKFWISKGYENSHQEKQYFDNSLIYLKNFIESQMNFSEKRKILELEKKFILKIENKNLIGFIDRVDLNENCEIEIFDYKTSNSMETKNNLENNLQLYVYAMAIFQEFKKYPKFAALWYLVHNKISKIEIEKEKVNEIKSEILKLINGIEEKNFSAKPSFFSCKFCDFSKICPNSKNK